MVLQHLAVGGSLNKLDFPRIVPGNTSVDTDIQFLWLSNCMHVGNICSHASRGCTCPIGTRRTGGMQSKAVVLSLTHCPQPTQWAGFSSVGGLNFLGSFRISPVWVL